MHRPAEVFRSEIICIHTGFEVVAKVFMKNSIFWDITPCRPMKVTFRRNMSLPSTGLKSNPNKKPTWIKMSVDFQQTARCYIPEDGTFQILSNFNRNYLHVHVKPSILRNILFVFSGRPAQYDWRHFLFYTFLLTRRHAYFVNGSDNILFWV
jgi:hypothetical protein